MEILRRLNREQKPHYSHGDHDTQMPQSGSDDHAVDGRVVAA